MAVLSRDRVIGEAEVRATLGAAVQVAASADIGIEAAVGALVDRLAREAPDALTNGTLYDRVIAEVERPLIRRMLAHNGKTSLVPRAHSASIATRCASGWIRWGSISIRTMRRVHPVTVRSEEHPSELQSLMRISYAVFCLKNKKRNNTNTK